MCSGFSIIEEGLTSYCTRKEINKKVPPRGEKIRRKIKYLGRMGKSKFYRNGYDKMYGVSDKSFPKFNRVKKIKVEFGNKKIEKSIKRNGCIMVLDSLEYYSKEVSCAYVKAINEVVKYADSEYEKIYFKMHPDNYGGWQENIFRNIISRGASSAREIGRSSFLEDIAIGAGVDVLVNVSATGLYCALFSEGDVYSFYNLLASTLSPHRRRGGSEVIEQFNWVPEVYWKNVEQLVLP
jgi:hypothetical protein